MRTRFWILGIGLMVLGVVFLVSSLSMGQAPGAARTANLKPLMSWDPGDTKCTWSKVSENQLTSLIDAVQKKIEVLSSRAPLSATTISQIADLYGQNGTFTTLDGLTLRGEREIVMYFQPLLACRHVTDFKIVTKYIYAKEFTDTFNRGNWKPEDVLQTVYFVFDNSFVLDGQPVSLPGATVYRHRGSCDNVNHD